VAVAASAPAPSAEASPPISPPATPVGGAETASTGGESPAPREAVAVSREAVAAPREVAGLPRETIAASREAPAALREGWTLQLAAYSTEARAMAQRQDLARVWPGAHVQKGDVGGRPVWRVRVGRYPTRREAEEAAQRMVAAGHRVIVVEDATR
jgi:DedD protein